MLTYQVTTGQRPIVTPRDFIFLVSVTEKAGAWMAGGCSISLDSFPPSSQHVRAWQYPTGMQFSTVQVCSTIQYMYAVQYSEVQVCSTVRYPTGMH